MNGMPNTDQDEWTLPRLTNWQSQPWVQYARVDVGPKGRGHSDHKTSPTISFFSNQASLKTGFVCFLTCSLMIRGGVYVCVGRGGGGVRRHFTFYILPECQPWSKCPAATKHDMAHDRDWRVTQRRRELWCWGVCHQWGVATSCY